MGSHTFESARSSHRIKEKSSLLPHSGKGQQEVVGWDELISTEDVVSDLTEGDQRLPSVTVRKSLAKREPCTLRQVVNAKKNNTKPWKQISSGPFAPPVAQN